MMNDTEKTTVIHFVDDNGESVTLEVVEETRINGINYLLVADDEDNAFIFKEVTAPENEEAAYEPVEDEKEIEYLGSIFEELLDDVELE